MLTVQEEVRTIRSIFVLEEVHEVFPESSRSPVTRKLFLNNDEHEHFFFISKFFHARFSPKLTQMCAGKALGKLCFLEEVCMKTGRR